MDDPAAWIRNHLTFFPVASLPAPVAPPARIMGLEGYGLEPGCDANLVLPILMRAPEDERRDEAVAGATHILVTHGHGDHTTGTRRLGKG